MKADSAGGGAIASGICIFAVFVDGDIQCSSERFSGYDLHPFWSYGAYFSGEVPQLLVENVMNVVVFLPVGIILGSLLRVKGSSTSEATKSMTWLMVAIIGCGISVTIESLLFFLMRGFSELDDVMHNTLGCLIGYGIYLIGREELV